MIGPVFHPQRQEDVRLHQLNAVRVDRKRHYFEAEVEIILTNARLPPIHKCAVVAAAGSCN